jgi:transketolase
VGEDGPTHEPIEHIMSLRLIPNLNVYRPADAVEVAMSYYSALQRKNGPSVLLFSRQNLPVITRNSSFKPEDVLNGAYTVKEAAQPQLVLVATGSELGASVEAAAQLEAQGVAVRVVSMPCAELFSALSEDAQRALIPSGVPTVVVEAGTTQGWADILRVQNLLSIGIDRYGASAPGELLAEKFGFTADAIRQKVVGWLGM